MIDIKDIATECCEKGFIMDKDGSLINLRDQVKPPKLLSESDAISFDSIYRAGYIENTEVCLGTIVRIQDATNASLERYFKAIEKSLRYYDELKYNFHVNLLFNSKTFISFLLKRQIIEMIIEISKEIPYISISYTFFEFTSESKFSFGFARALNFDSAKKVLGFDNIIKNNTTFLSLDFDITKIHPGLYNFLRSGKGIADPVIILRENYYNDEVSNLSRLCVDYATLNYQISLLDDRYYQGRGFEMWSGLSAFPMVQALISSIVTVDTSYDTKFFLPGSYDPTRKLSETAPAFALFSAFNLTLDEFGNIQEKDCTNVLKICPWPVTTNGDKFLNCMEKGVSLFNKKKLHSQSAYQQSNAVLNFQDWARAQGASGSIYSGLLDTVESRGLSHDYISCSQKNLRYSLSQIRQGSFLDELNSEDAMQMVLDRYKRWYALESDTIFDANFRYGIPFNIHDIKEDYETQDRMNDFLYYYDPRDMGYTPGLPKMQICS
ncbi:hypothetical protein HOJ01_03130 [bacterium]|nr:hypothetical protein [bacterium]MBT6293777.1 hypothetical protein [bacterium]